MWIPTNRPSLRVPIAFLICLATAHWLSFHVAVWLFAAISFASLREYLSLADLRPEDRWAMAAAYLGIPLQFYLIADGWYGFFIVCVPVYVFLIVPFLIALGGGGRGGARGSVFSIGAIDFGLFLFAYCLGHLAYLTYLSTALALLLVLGDAVCDVLDRAARFVPAGSVLKIVVGAPAVFGLAWLLGKPAEMQLVHAVSLAVLMPVLVCMGNFTLRTVEEDLGIEPTQLEPGRGRWIDGLRAQLFAAPVVFHYLHYFEVILVEVPTP